MTFEKITENVENISLLPDNPILSPAELKAEFDKGNKIIKEKFNKLIDDLNNEGVGDTFPIGAITEYPVSESVPNNWLLCNGQAVSRIEYEELFEILGTTWGAGDGSTTFNLPDRQGLIAIGAGTHTDSNGDSKTFVLGQEYGEYEHTLTVAEMASHSHQYPVTKEDGAEGWARCGNWNGYAQHNSGSTGGDQAHNNIQPSIATNFIIKARQSSGVSASVIQEDGTPNETDVYSSEAIVTLLAGTVLYENDTGTKQSITLSDSAVNYRYIEIFYKDSHNLFNSVKIHNPDQKMIDLHSFHVYSQSGTAIADTSIVWFNGNKLMANTDKTGNSDADNYGSWSSWNNTIEGANKIFITRVIGYK